MRVKQEKPIRQATERRNLTKKVIEALPTPKEKRTIVYDTQARGLGVMVQPSGRSAAANSTGRKSYFWFRKVQGYPKWQTIGAFPDLTVEQARGKADELNAKLAKWKSDNYDSPSPFKPRMRVPTLGNVLEHYIEKHVKATAKNPKRAVVDRRGQFKYVASWRNRPLTTIRREDVRELHAQTAAKHGGRTANALVEFLRALFNHAADPDVALWNGVNPCAKPKKFLAPMVDRTRTLRPEEKPKFFAALEREPHRDLRDVLLIALVTGARRGTILEMRWDEIDWEHATWTIPKPKGKKNKDPHVVTLMKLAVAVLKNRPRKTEWVFPGRKGHLTTVKKPWKKFREHAKVNDFVFHDLRRTLATAEGDTGASTEAIQKTLGHARNSAATKIYDTSDRREEVRAAIDEAVTALLADGRTSKRKLLAAPRG